MNVDRKLQRLRRRSRAAGLMPYVGDVSVSFRWTTAKAGTETDEDGRIWTTYRYDVPEWTVNYHRPIPPRRGDTRISYWLMDSIFGHEIATGPDLEAVLDELLERTEPRREDLFDRVYEHRAWQRDLAAVQRMIDLLPL